MTAGARLAVRSEEIDITAVRAQGAGGQNVNKVSNAVHLRFDIRASSLPEAVKSRLLRLPDQRINRDGVVIIKAQQHRSLELNRTDAVARLHALVERAASPPKRRVPTRPSRSARERRMDAKQQRARLKTLRARVAE